mgnify:CR=1 FL=1
MDLTTNLSPTRARLFAYLAFVLIFFIAYSDSMTVLFNLWTGVEQTIYQYGFLVLASTCYLLYLKRPQIVAFRSRPTGWALLPSLVLTAVWFVASLVGVQTVQLAVLPFLILAMTSAFFGTKFLRLIGLPILLLLFAIPLWWPLLPFLKDATTLVTEGFLRAIAKPVFVEGYFLHLPGGSFFVDDGCAGLRFLLVTLILSFMSIDLYALKWKQGLVLLGIAVSLALVANWIRVIVVVLVGDYTKMQHRLVSDHNDLGWVVYAVVVLLPFFFLVGKLMTKEEPHPANSIHAGQTASDSKHYLLIYLFALIIMISGPALSAMVRFQEYPDRVVSMPQSSQGWRTTSNTDPAWKANYLDASQYLYSQFEGAAGQVELHIFNYANQQEGVELINVDNTLTDEEVWRTLPGTESQFVIDLDEGGTIDVLSAEIESESGQRKLLRYWFDVGGLHSSGTYSAKLYQLIALLNGRKDASLIVVASDCGFNCSNAQELISSFTGDMYSSITERL